MIKIRYIFFLVFLFSHVVVNGQASKMMYADTTRTGKPFSKNPHVIRYKGRFLMYSSVLPQKGKNAREIEITESSDLIHWKNVGYIYATESYEKNGISAPCVLVIKGKVHIFYQTYGNGANDAICHAVSTNGITSFIRNATNPIFKPNGKWTCGRAIDAEVFYFKGKYLMYFATRDPNYKFQLQGVASTPENSSFCKNTWTHLTVNEPAVKPELQWEGDCIEATSFIYKNKKLYMFYAGGYHNTPQQIGVAVSTDGLHWKRLSQEPFLRVGKQTEWNCTESGHPNIFEYKKRTYLFFQGNNDHCQTWWISNIEVFWNKNGPFLK